MSKGEIIVSSVLHRLRGVGAHPDHQRQFPEGDNYYSADEIETLIAEVADEIISEIFDQIHDMRLR